MKVSELNTNIEFLDSEPSHKSFNEIGNVRNVNTLNSNHKFGALNNLMKNIPFTRNSSTKDKA